MRIPAKQSDVAAMLENCRAYWMNYSHAIETDDLISIYRTDVPHPQLNGVMQIRSGGKHLIAAAVARLAGAPSVWWIGEDSYPGASEDIALAGGKLLSKVPVMAVHLPEVCAEAPELDDFLVEQLDLEDDLASWVGCYCEPMGIADQGFPTMLSVERSRSDRPGQLVRFAARSGGEVIGTSELFVHAGMAGIYLVATKKTHRHMGVGTALTYAACKAGLDRGLNIATLQASSSGYHLYKKLGFEQATSYDLFSLPMADV